MSSNAANRAKKPQVNHDLNSSIVHKPFATGTINIFNPYKSKQDGKLIEPKLFLNAELEAIEENPHADLAAELKADELKYRDRNWIDSLFSPWGISAIALLLGINLISAGAIWRSVQTTADENNERIAPATIGNTNLAEREFMPLNLSTLSKIEPNGGIAVDESAQIVPISPALAPLNSVTNLSLVNTQYHYVLTEYTGDRSLTLARQKVEQISLVNFPQGVFIYLGAFTDREEAEQFVSQLQQDNFAAQIYPFN